VKNRKNKLIMTNSTKIFLVIFLFGISGMLMSGCEKQSRHKVLTFFFTGVPPLGGEISEMVELDTKVKKRKRRLNIPKVFIHGPKAAGECFYCHDTESSLSFRKVRKAGARMPKLDEIKPGRLAVSPKDLCTQCHTSKSAELRYSQNMWVHGPLSDGTCTACHDYHQTNYQYMLLKEKSVDLCTQCHTKGYIMLTEAHKNDDECISCHNPHVGANRLMLRKDFNEIF
jgi:predicted CXXCH cytochrome family protein